MPIAGALWFLTAMFFTEVFFWLLHRLKNTVWIIIIAIMITILGMACATYLPFRLPLALDVGLVGVGFCQVGKMLKEKWAKILELNIFYSIIGIILFSIMGLFTNSYINLRTGNYGIWILFVLNAVGMTISLWIFSRYFFEWMNNKRKSKFLLNLSAWIQGMGKDSIVYLCLNQLAIMIAMKLVTLFLPFEGILFSGARKLLVFVVTMLELFLFQKLITKTKLKVVIGR